MADVRLIITGQNLTKQAIDQLKKDLADTTAKLNALNQGTAKVGDESKKARAGVNELAIGLGAMSAASLLIVRSSIQAAAQMDRMKRGLAAVAGSAGAATKQMLVFRELAKMPGLGLPEVVKAATSLQALDFTLSNTTEIIKQWGNELVRMGKGRAEMEHIVLALTQMVGKGKGFGQEIRQIAEVMPSIRKHMQMAFGTSASEEFEKMGITAQKFISGITGELAKQVRVSGGAANAMENFADAVFIAKVALGENLLPALTQVLEMLTKVLEKFAEMPDVFRSMVSWGTLSVGIITGLGAALAGLVIIVDKAVIAVKALSAAMVWLNAHPAVALASIIAVVAISLGALYLGTRKAKGEVADLGKTMDEAKQSFDRFSKMDKLISEIDELRQKKTLTVIETKRLEQAQKDIIALEPRMLAYYDKEGKAIAETTEKMKEKVKQTREMTYQQMVMGATEARRALPQQEEEIKKQADKVNQLQESWRKADEMAKKAQASRWKGERDNAELFYKLAAGYYADFEKEKSKLGELEAERDRLRADIEAYDKFRKGTGTMALPTPEALKRPGTKPISEEERKLQDEIRQMQTARIEDETQKAIAEARSEAEGKISEYKAMLKAEGLEEGKAAQIRNAIRETELTRDYKIAQARKKQAEELAKTEKKEAEERIALQQAISGRQNEVIDKEIARFEEAQIRKARFREEEAKKQEDQYQADINRISQINQMDEGEYQGALDRKEQLEREAQGEKQRVEKAWSDFLERQRKEQEKRNKENIERIWDELNASEEKKRDGARKTLNAWYRAEDARINLIDDATQQELALIKLRHEANLKAIDEEMDDAELSVERYLELKREQAYLEQQSSKRRLRYKTGQETRC